MFTGNNSGRKLFVRTLERMRLFVGSKCKYYIQRITGNLKQENGLFTPNITGEDLGNTKGDKTRTST